MRRVVAYVYVPHFLLLKETGESTALWSFPRRLSTLIVKVRPFWKDVDKRDICVHIYALIGYNPCNIARSFLQ